MIIRTIENIQDKYGCTEEQARRYIDFRDEGYTQYQALVMAGLTDAWEEKCDCSQHLEDPCFVGPNSLSDVQCPMCLRWYSGLQVIRMKKDCNSQE